MASPHSLDPNFTPGARLSRLPMRTGDESLEDFYRDLFASPGPEHDRQSLLRLLDEDVADGAAAPGRSGAMDHLGQAFRRIDAWTLQGDSLPPADRAELKRRVAHNLLAARPGLTLAARDDGRSDSHAALLREVQAEHAAWRQGWAIGPAGPGDAPYGRRPWAETSGPRQPRQPWDERPDTRQARQPWDEQAPRQEPGPADALHRLGRGEPLDLAAGPDRHEPRRQDDTKTYWYVTPKPAACDKCLAMAGKLYPAEPERPHPNCTCEIVSRKLTAPQAAALQDDLADQAWLSTPSTSASKTKSRPPRSRPTARPTWTTASGARTGTRSKYPAGIPGGIPNKANSRAIRFPRKPRAASRSPTARPRRTAPPPTAA